MFSIFIAITNLLNFSTHLLIMKTTNRRKFLGAVGALCAGTAASAMPSIPQAAVKGARSPLAHHVFFWLKNPDSIEDRDKLLEGVKTLKKIETVREIHAGLPASTEKRPVVDTSWQVSVLVFFKDLAGQSTYEAHPVHLEFIKNNGHLLEKVIVYDAMEVI